MIARNATAVKIAANAKGEAMFSFRVGGKQRRILVWARRPTASAA
jgi:hypothetical protein